jgi:hypothetical protein
VSRGRRIVAVIGAPESGKSTVAQKLYRDAIRREGRRSVRALDPGCQFTGGEMPGDVDGWLEQLRPPSRTEPARVRFLLADDGDQYLPKSPAKGSAWLDLYLRHRWWRTDVLITARRIQNLSPTLLSAVEHLFVFRMNPSDHAGRKRLEDIAPGLTPPTEPFKFVAYNAFSGLQTACRTLPGGGWRAL